LDFPTSVVRQEEVKGIQIGKEVVKLLLFSNGHDFISKTMEKLHQKNPRHQKQSQQSSKMQSQLTKISSLSIHQQ
jgi:hypothetical protein